MALTFLTALVVAADLTVGFAAAESRHGLHEKREILDTVHSDWRPGTKLSPDAIVPIRIALTQSNLNSGFDRLMSVSHPESADYGQHLTADEVRDIFAPPDESVKAVREWLIAAGLNSDAIAHSGNKGWLAVDMPVADAERLFESQLYEYEHSKSGKYEQASALAFQVVSDLNCSK
jgi:tripeptidyl-peptidase I